MRRRIIWIIGGALLIVAGLFPAWYALGSRAAGRAESEAVRASDLSVVVDVSERTLYAIEGGRAIRTYDVAVGTRKHPTPRGRFAIEHLVWNPRWVPPDAKWARHKETEPPGPDNPMGRVKMFFQEPDYYIHGTPLEGTLGEAASHGCIRMANRDAIELAQLLMEHGGKPRPESWFQRVLDHFRDTRQVYLSRPVRVTVRG